jgi:hypothetical protein
LNINLALEQVAITKTEPINSLIKNTITVENSKKVIKPPPPILHQKQTPVRQKYLQTPTTTPSPSQTPSSITQLSTQGSSSFDNKNSSSISNSKPSTPQDKQSPTPPPPPHPPTLLPFQTTTTTKVQLNKNTNIKQQTNKINYYDPYRDVIKIISAKLPEPTNINKFTKPIQQQQQQQQLKQTPPTPQTTPTTQRKIILNPIKIITATTAKTTTKTSTTTAPLPMILTSPGLKSKSQHQTKFFYDNNTKITNSVVYYPNNNNSNTHNNNNNNNNQLENDIKKRPPPPTKLPAAASTSVKSVVMLPLNNLIINDQKDQKLTKTTLKAESPIQKSVNIENNNNNNAAIYDTPDSIKSSDQDQELPIYDKVIFPFFCFLILRDVEHFFK